MTHHIYINQQEYVVELSPDNQSGTINDEKFSIDLLQEKAGKYHLIKDHGSYNVEIISHDPEKKKMDVRVNGNIYHLKLKDQYDDLLKKMGMETIAGKISEVKAPMPGLVLEVLVSPGQELAKGDPVMVLEAMKMENVLKSPTQGIVKKINVEQKQAVEKGQVLVSFE